MAEVTLAKRRQRPGMLPNGYMELMLVLVKEMSVTGNQRRITSYKMLMEVHKLKKIVQQGHRLTMRKLWMIGNWNMLWWLA